MRQTLAALCITLLLGICPAFGAPPATITYQGYLTNSVGAPINGHVSMILSLYDSASGQQAPLWSESQPDVNVANGIYTVQLGSVAALNLPFDTTYYLGVAVGGESEMTPRLTLTSAPTVFRAMSADSADKLNQACGNGQVLMYASASSSWGCITPGALATRDTIADAVVAPNAGIATSKLSGAVTAITNHGLGTAATLNAGTAAGNVVQLDGSAKLPAVDGSQLTNVTVLSDAKSNVKSGTGALAVNSAGRENVALGENAMTVSKDSRQDVAVGFNALKAQNYNGGMYWSLNVGIGAYSLSSNNPTTATNGIYNTSVGGYSLAGNTTGSFNIGLGYSAGTFLTTGNYNIDIGNKGVPAESNTIRIGDVNQTKTFIAGIEGATGVSNPKTVVIDPATGQLGSAAITAAPSAATTVTTQAYSDSGTVGTATTFAREDHKHSFPASTKDTTAATGILKGNGTAITAAASGDFPTLNQNTTGTAANVTGTVAVVNGGTGATTLTGYVKGAGTSAMTASATIPSTDITGLGSAAALNVGTAASNIVQLNGSAQLPAVDGSLLTGVKLLSFGVDYDAELEQYGPGTNSNTAGGTDSLPTGTSGYYNTAFGARALTVNNSGRDNTAVGSLALLSNTTGSYNTAFGSVALATKTAGSFNIALGDGAGVNLVTGDKNIFIGNQGMGTDSNTIRIGADANHSKTFIAGIYSTDLSAVYNNKPVMISDLGQLGTVNAMSVVNGGTGLETLTSGSYLVGNGTDPLTVKTPAQVKTDLALTKSDVGLANAENTALSTWVGSANITTLGTITTGTVPVARVSGLGSAATLTAGTAAGNVVQLDGSAKLPTVDGSQLIAIKLPSDANGNVKAGASALNNNTTGDANTAIGTSALVSNTAAGRNTAIGFYALINQNYSNGGSLYAADNTAVGFQSLVFNNPTSAGNGIGNTALGSNSLTWNTTGRNNIGIGYLGGYNLTTGNNNIDIGNMGVAGESSTIRIGDANQTKTFIAGIEGATGVSNPKTVVIDPATGQLGSAAITAAPSAATTVTTQAYSDSGTVGTATAFAREDHKHAFPTSTKDTTAATGILKGNGTAITAAVAGDFPTLNQNTTGTAANVTGTVAVGNGGTGATDAAGARSALGLVIGTNVLAPAGNGSQLTGIQLLSDANFSVKAGSYTLSNNTGTSNNAIGDGALMQNTTGNANVAIGGGAMGFNKSASRNIAIGHSALSRQSYDPGSTSISNNIAIGFQSMNFNNPTSASTGVSNTAVGSYSLYGNTTGANNIGIGINAGRNLTTGDNNIMVGNMGVVGEGNTIRIGDNNQTKTFISGIYSVAGGGLTTPKSVVIGSDGQLGAVASTSGTVTNVTVGSGLNITNGSTTPNITLGTVPVGNGGTGATTLTGYVKGSGTSAMTASATIPNTDISGLGTAATLNVGIAADNIVKLDGSAKLPAVDGSQLTAIKLLSDAILNVKAGSSALNSNTTGFENIAIGSVAMTSNTVASRNVAIGSAALNKQSYNSGSAYSSFNTAVGYQSMLNNNPISTITGVNNTALGALSLFNNNTGKNNIGIGWQAGLSLTTGDYNIDIGNAGVAGEGNTIRIGDSNQTKTFISGIRGVTTGSANGIAVLIDSNGQLGTVSSSIRYKEDVNDMGDLTSRLFGLRPVTFRYKTQPAAVHYGLIAEEVDQVMPELVVRGNDGQIETVAYHELTPMLLNELQKEHKLVQDLTAENADLKARLLRIEKALGL